MKDEPFYPTAFISIQTESSFQALIEKAIAFRCNHSSSSAYGLEIGSQECSNTTRGATWSRKDVDVKLGER